MDRRLLKRYQKDLATKQTYEEMKSRKAATKLRRALKGKGGARKKNITEENWDEIQEERKALTRPVRDVQGPPPAAVCGEGISEGIVMSVASARCRVFADGKEIDALVPREIAVQQKSALAVGDRVMLDEDRRIATVLPRRTVLARPDPLNKHLQRLIAANIDVVIHVVSVKAPPLRPRLVDRYLIAIQRGGALPVLFVNKIDLLEPEEREATLRTLHIYRDLDVPVIAGSATSGEGIDELRRLVQGKTAALVGHSGVGKSSILNALDSRLALATRDVHKRGTGRHTTTASTLFDFGDGTYLIDTPGIREFGLWDLDRDSLRDYFPEFEEPAEYCRFNDCTHVHEPGCEVKERAARGAVSAARYDTYLRLYGDLEQ
jgi:ribosome biogenesis GTPase